MVEETAQGERARTTTASAEFRTPQQGWVQSYIRALQRLDLESHNTSHEAYDIRCPPKAIPQSAESFRTHRWPYPANTPAADETRPQSRVFTSVPQSAEYYDTEMDE